MCAQLGFRPGDGRLSEEDAFLDFTEAGVQRSCPIELKSTTKGSVSTARDVGPQHLQKWRRRVWVFGFYNLSGSDLQRVLVLGPEDMEAWIGKLESYVAPDFALGERTAAKLNLEDLDVICGEKARYSLADAKALMKRQWTASKYALEKDSGDGYTPAKMLEMLKLRATYLNKRGATLNNPHIPKSFFARYENRVVDVRQTTLQMLREATHERVRTIALHAGL